ncbi:hypothetical protein [Thermococcus sp. Bubb.Bath]|uniref:hypothetical protein n=1 Tax=Thermococcus sp. Bubb.Bath TaxID=1638242 RepID=UPI001439123A|nr:hypothetical protein [Thermococcus sp. Bubb.Bath]NJF25576.1 hypothetical protein [Thermococcus sp. Bubb.Bath]
MRNHIKLSVSGILLIFVSGIFISYLGIAKGLYSLSASLSVLIPWYILIILGNPKGTRELQEMATYGLMVLFIVTLASLWSFGYFTAVVNLLEVFAIFMVFPILVLGIGRKLSRWGKKVKYPPKATKEFWGFQWLVNLTLTFKSSEPLYVFISLLPATVGGYLIYKAFTAAEKGQSDGRRGNTLLKAIDSKGCSSHGGDSG